MTAPKGGPDHKKIAAKDHRGKYRQLRRSRTNGLVRSSGSLRDVALPLNHKRTLQKSGGCHVMKSGRLLRDDHLSVSLRQ